MEKEKWREAKQKRREACCLSDRVRRITFGPNPAKNETLGARLGEKSPAGVQKAVLGSLVGDGWSCSKLTKGIPTTRMTVHSRPPTPTGRPRTQLTSGRTTALENQGDWYLEGMRRHMN